jgi:hypothetical protein
MKRILIVSFVSMVLCVVAQPQDIRVVSGGSRTAPDPNDKKLIMLIAEAPTYKLSLRRPDKGGSKNSRMIPIHLRIENLSDKPLAFQTSKFNV